MARRTPKAGCARAGVSANYVDRLGGQAFWAQTIIEAVNMIGSLVNGPLLAVFLLGMLTRWGTQAGALAGLAAGLAGNFIVARWVPEVSWLWWNVIGFVIAIGTGAGVSLLRPRTGAADDRLYIRSANTEKNAQGYFESGLDQAPRKLRWAAGRW